VPFGADKWLLLLTKATAILAACLQQVSCMFTLFFDPAQKLRPPSRLPSLCNLFHSARTNSATWTVSYCNNRLFIPLQRHTHCTQSRVATPVLQPVGKSLFKEEGS
jgi:hypothetical protein